MKFFRAAEANQEIERLTAELASVKAQAQSDKQAHESAIANLNATIEQQKTNIATLTTERDAARTDLATAQGELATARTDLKTSNEKVTSLEAEAATADERAQQMLAGMGINLPMKRGESAKSEDGKTEEQLWAEFHALKNFEAKQAFFAKHKAILGRY